MRHPLYLFKYLQQRLWSSVTPSPSPDEKVLIDELKKKIQGLPSLHPPQSKSESAWSNNRKRIRDFLINEDPRKFFLCETLRNTMLVGNTHYTGLELKTLRKAQFWKTRWEKALTESSGLKFLPHPLFPLSNGNLIHHGFHILQFEEKTKRSVEDCAFIFEFGGGYGNMCRLIHRLGFKGKYVIFDLPEFSLLQEFFLKLNGLNVLDTADTANNRGQQGIACVADMSELHSMLPKDGVDLFIATWSLSETPLKLRENFRSIITNSRYGLFAYQDRFEEVDNKLYFAELINSKHSESWDWKIPFLPGNRYLITAHNNI